MKNTVGPPATARKSVVLPCTPSSARTARSLLREILSETGHVSWSEAAELAATEIVGNAVLHAHTDITLTIVVGPGKLLVEVRDGNPALPSPRRYDERATTGRGMALVATLVADHGVSDAGPDGKTVWFSITDGGAELSEESLLAAWDDVEWDVDPATGADLSAARSDAPVEGAAVHLLGLPPTLWMEAGRHHDALIRELVLYLAEHDGLEVDIPAADRARSTLSAAVNTAISAAQEAGLTRKVVPEGHPSPLPNAPGPLDLELTVPGDLAPAFAALQDTLDAAERLARADLLLVRPGLPEIVAVRDWACEQIMAQLAGVAASTWPGTDHPRFTAEVDERQPVDVDGWDPASVQQSDRGVVAADDANRIVAVSPSLARLVGWDAEDLVGRRVVTLIPRSLREAHVAGFTRHLTTGEAHVLDVPLTLPVLRSDETEVLCHFLVQKLPEVSPGSIYLAWIDPV